jgi:nitrogen fixation NifU-like protein
MRTQETLVAWIRRIRKLAQVWLVRQLADDGDVMKLQIKVNKDGIIEDAKFKTYGCGSAIASSSLVTELLKGMSLDQAYTIKNSAIAEELALPPVKIHCSVLAEDAIKSAIEDYRKKQNATNNSN